MKVAAALALAISGLLTLAPLAASAQETGVAERRLVPEAGVDFYGGDIRSIYGTSLTLCSTVCLSEPACRAFTFNQAANACFLKSGVTRRDPFPDALSAEIVDTPPDILARATLRAQDLNFLPARWYDSARQQSLDAGLIAADEPLFPLLSAANKSDDANAWLSVAGAAMRLEPQDYNARQEAQTNAVSAAINAYMRAADAPLQANAAWMLGAALETAGEGRLSLDALRLSAELAPGEAIAAAVDRAEGLFGFRVLDRQVDADSAAPRACIVFSEGVAAAGVEYGDFVRVTGNIGAVEAKENQLCVDGLSHGTQYTITLRAGLPAASGEVLRRDVVQDIYVRDRKPDVRFLGRAFVLPKTADASIPVSSVNVSEVALNLYRVGARNLAAVVRGGEFGNGLTGYDQDRMANDLGEAVWQGTGEVASPLNQDVVTALPIGDVVSALEPGVYAMTASAEAGTPESGTTLPTQWFVVTDLGLATLKGADGLHVFLRGLGTAEPRAGVETTLIARNNDVLGKAVTDAEGHVRFDPGLLRGKGGAEAALVTAEDRDGDFAFLDLTEPGFDLSDRGVGGRPAPKAVDVFISTERGAYRPGEPVFATILARDRSAHAISGLPLTAIVTRPDSVQYTKMTLPDAGSGGRVMRLDLDEGAQRGGWRVAVHADPKAPPLATAGFLVEDFVPERIDLALSMPEGPVDPDAGAVLDLQADYLFGAPGAGLALEGEVSVQMTREVPGFAGYRFGLEDEPYQSGYEPLTGGLMTDAQGQARLPLPIPDIGPVSRPLELTATLRASDGSGRPVERSLTRPLTPANPLIGIRPLFEGAVDEGGTASFEAIALDRSLTRTHLGPLTWTLTRVITTFQWYEMDGNWNYEPITRRERLATGQVELTDAAPARLDFPVDWGSYELRLEATDGRLIATSLGFDAGWSAGGGAAETPDRLDLSLDRNAYSLGETVRVHVAARMPGQALIAVMSDRLISSRTVALDKGDGIVELTVTEDWGPGAYVTATLIRPMDVAARRNPARAIGLSWASVDPGPARLEAAFEGPQEAPPRTVFETSLRVDGITPGDTAYVTVAAVDVGILNLTAFDAPDPDGYYFGQRRLGVEIRDVYGRLIDGMQGTPGRVRSGGDAGMSMKAPPPTEELVAVFTGPLTVGPDGRVPLSISLPDFNGTVRLMAIAWSETGVGSASQDILVRDPVVVQANLPRFLAPGDETQLGLDLTHVSGPAGPVALSVSASDPAMLPNGSARTADLAPSGRQTFSIPLVAGEIGVQQLEISTTIPDGALLTKSLTLDVRANDPVLARQTRITLDPGSGLILDSAVLDGLRPDGASVTLAAGALARFDVPGLLQALDRYPFGCTEQVTSRALPLLYFATLAKTLELQTSQDLDARIAQAIRDVLANQTASGSFGLWSAVGGEPWLDAYVTDFLSRARMLGHAVPDRAFTAALDNLSNRVNAYGDFEAGGEDLAYALMVLARERRAAIGDLRYYADTRAAQFATPLAQAQLGLALAYYGDQARADALFRLASEGALSGEEAQVYRADFGSGLRDTAGVLALADEAGSQAIDRAALTRIVTAPQDDRSPQEALWTLLAAQAAIEGTGGPTISVDGQAVVPPVFRLDAAQLQADAPVAVTNDGPEAAELVLTAFGVPTQPELAQGNGYRIERQYFTLDGVPADPAAVPLNARLVAVVTVHPERDLQARLMVMDPLPAGLEIDNPNLLRAGQTGQLAWLQADDVASHVEFRTDRFLAAVDWQGAKPFRLAYMVRAISPGTFHRPAASVEDMYRPAYRARTGAGQVQVLDLP